MKAKRIRFPITVKRGSSNVKIYRDRHEGGTYYRVVYHLGGKRVRLSFNELEKAKDEAEAKASQLSRGDIDALQITGKDRLVYGRALDAIREFDVPLDGAALEYAEAKKQLDGVSLLEAIRFYARHHGKDIKRKRVAEAVQEMIAAKEQKGVSDVYIVDLRYRLGLFAQSFHCDLNTVSPDDVATFFAHLGLGPCSHNNFMRTLRTFLGFAQRHGWLSKEVDLLARVEKRSTKQTPVEIFTSAELSKLLGHASPEVAPCIALGAFAGLRQAEILRLDWRDLERHAGFVEVAAHKAKTQARRIVPITENLARWLSIAPRTGTGTRVWPGNKDGYFKAVIGTARKANIEWRHNALRHSFISYRLAEIADVNRVALEAGNSPQMIFRHYRELTTPDKATTWFSIAPAAAANVVPMLAGAGQSR